MIMDVLYRLLKVQNMTQTWWSSDAAVKLPPEAGLTSKSVSYSKRLVLRSVRFPRGEDLPSQLLQELRVVRREELHHEAEDGVFRP